MLGGSAVRTFLDASSSELGAAEVSVQCSDPTHEVKVVRLASGDGRWCLEAGIEGTKWVIRSVVEGVAGSSLTNGADDTPMSAACETNHLLGGSPVAFRFVVRLVNNTISLYVNGATSATLSHALTDDEIEAFGQNRHWGLASDVTGARAINVQQCTLEADITPRLDGLVGVCGGNLYAILDDSGPRLIAAGRFNTTGPVSLAAYQQHVYGVDGTHAVDFNFTTLTVSNWGDASGDGVLPGAVETFPGSGVYVSGTSRMTVLYNVGDRVGTSGDPQDPQNAFESAIGNANDWNASKFAEPGRATALGAELSGRIGEPIVGAVELDRQTVLLLCRGSIWRKVGDFALGNPLLERVESAYGCSGKDAAVAMSQGVAIVHAPEGVVSVTSGGAVRPLSQYELTEGITIPRENIDDYIVQVLRDPARFHVWFILTPRETDDEHVTVFVRCERTADTKGFGWFPVTFPAAMRPTACCLWKGRVVFGCADGYLRTFSDTSKNDDGEAIDVNMPVLAAPDGGRAGPNHEVVLCKFAVEPSVATHSTSASDRITYSVFGGTTVEMAYAGTERWTLLQSSLVPLNTTPVMRIVRAPAVVIEFSNDADPDKSIRLELVWGEITLGPRMSRARVAAPSIPAPTRSPEGDVSHPDAAPPQTPTQGPGAGDNPGGPPGGGGGEGEMGFGVGWQSPFELAEQNPEVETTTGSVQQSGGGGGPGGGGGGGFSPGGIDTGSGQGPPPDSSDGPGVLPW